MAAVVLVVETDVALRRFTRSVLEENGYRVLDAEDPAKALVLIGADNASIDLLLADMVMPYLSGPELYEELCGRLPGLRVVYLSGSTDSIMQRAMESRYTFVVKPYDPEELIHAVK